MKKIALALLSLFLTTPCLANIHINPSTVESVVKEFVSADKMVSVISEYNNQLKQSNGTGISAQKLWNICAIAGWDIKQPSGKSQCQKFVNALVEKSSIKFYHACDKQYKGKAGYICVDDFFTNKIYGGTQVNLTPGQTLAKEYARLKHNDSTVQCRNKFDPGILDDTLMCTSHNKNAYYEFVFDDLEEPKDQTIKNSIQNAICRMYDAKPTTAGCAGGGTNVSGTATCWSASCAADSAKCAKINQSMAKFGYSAIYKDNKCEINFNSINDKSELKTAYGIDNFIFCHGIQVANIPSVESYLKQYIAERAGVSASSVKCDSGFNTYTGTGCTANGITDMKDDIKTCRVGNNQIDFVFDDINEKWKKTVEGGVQGMSCIVTGGTYSGKRCIGLGEQQCNTLRQSNLKECPECKAAKWDKETQSCLLPSSKSAQNLQKGVNIGLIVGGAVVGVALTVVTAGAAGAPVTAIVLTGIETVGAGIELTSQLKINGIADGFLVESNKCKNATCAKKMLSQNLQRMANYANDMTAAEADAVDTEMARLANLIPDDDEIWATMLVNGTDMADNKLGFFDTDSWEPEQVWRAVGIGLQLASLITGITKWAISKSSRVVKSTAAIKQKFARAIQSIDNAPESTLRAKRLELKQLAKNGKKVSNADDVLKIPAGNFATSALDGAKQKLVALGGGIDDFDGLINNVVHADAPFPGHWTRNTLSDEEFDALTSWFKTEHNLTLNVDDYGILKIDRPSNGGASSIAALKAKYRSGKTTSSFDISQLTTNNNIATTGTGFRVADDGTIIREIPTTSQGIKDPIVVPKGQMSAPTQGVDLGNGYTMMEDGKILGPVDYNARDPELDEMIEFIRDDAKRGPNYTQADYDDHMSNRAALVDAYQDLVDNDRITDVAKFSRQQYLDIIASDEKLKAKALGFDKLSLDERAEFAQDLVKEFDARIGIGTEYGSVPTSQIEHAPKSSFKYDFAAETDNGTITFRDDFLKSYSLDEFMNTLSHEHMHDIDARVPGYGSATKQNVEFGAATSLDGSDPELYKKNILEAGGYGVGDHVGENFLQDLKKLINSRPKK